jgi:hypothetical protein
MAEARKEGSPGWFRSAWDSLRGKRPSADESADSAAKFRVMYELFREILALNDSLLQLIADLEDKLLSGKPFALDPLIQRVRRSMFDLFVMVKDLNQIAGGCYTRLYDALGRLNTRIEAACAVRGGEAFGGAEGQRAAQENRSRQGRALGGGEINMRPLRNKPIRTPIPWRSRVAKEGRPRGNAPSVP